MSSGSIQGTWEPLSGPRGDRSRLFCVRADVGSCGAARRTRASSPASFTAETLLRGTAEAEGTG